MPFRTCAKGKGITLHDAFNKAFARPHLLLIEAIVKVDHGGLGDLLEYTK